MFFDQSDNDAPVLLDAAAGSSITGRELSAAASVAGEALRGIGGRVLVFLLCRNDIPTVTAYMACLKSRLPVVLIEQAGFAKLGDDLLQAYRPAIVVGDAGQSPAYQRAADIPELPPVWTARTAVSHELHDDLAVLLTTSGSTGSPKCVRLTAANLDSNAQSIRQYLGLTADERSIQSLPLHYSYGLSLLNSHLAAGALTVLTDASFMSKPFWETFAARECTSFAGVPFMYETLHRLRFNPRSQPTLKTMTQAGGNLRPEIKTQFAARLAENGGRFFAMYGQTEATARISYVPAERLAEKASSIGIAIPGGELEVQTIEGVEAPHGELVYRGPNVMMGYAECAADLGKGDELKGVLRTGDIGWRDADGFFHVSGRLKRFAKCQGRRVSLDDVERRVESQFGVMAAAVEHSKGLGVFFSGDAEVMDVRSEVAGFLMIPPSAIHCEAMPQLPVLPSGKKDYRALPA